MKKMLVLIIFIPIILLILYRIFMIIPWSGEGTYESSPDKSKLVSVVEYSTEYFWGGTNNYSIFKIKDEKGKLLLKHAYFHPGQIFEWYYFGKIEWESPDVVKFSLKSNPILYLYLNNPSGIIEGLPIK